MQTIGDVPYLDYQEEIEEYRGRLPHWYQTNKMQFITFRLGDSLPQCALQDIRSRKEAFIATHEMPLSDEDIRALADIVTQKDEEWLHADHGSCILRIPEVADILESVLVAGEGKKYELIDYVIMPNHVHILITPFEGVTHSSIVSVWKGVSSRRIKEWAVKMHMKIPTPFWQREFYDRIIRSYDHQKHVHRYIGENIRRGGVLWKGKNRE